MGEREGTAHAVTEDEAALYDRQIRLWGLDAQNRIRKAHILVINLDGLTTEAIKNWVLAGISTLTVADTREETEWHDLSAGFFWREADVGEKRLPPAAARIQALNPLVKINVLSTAQSRDLLKATSSRLVDLHANVVVVGVPSGPAGMCRKWGRKTLESLNQRCRDSSMYFYCARTLGLNGWMFNDLGESYEYVVEKPDKKVTSSAPTATASEMTNGNPNDEEVKVMPQASSAKKLEKRRQAFVPLQKALSMTWKGLSKVQKKQSRPSAGAISVWAIWDLIEEKSTDDSSHVNLTASEIEEQFERIVKNRETDHRIFSDVKGQSKSDFFEALEVSFKQAGEFSPICAILGGVLSQDVLNALGGRRQPIVNWFQFDGLNGSGPIHAFGTSPSTVVSA